MPSDHTCARCGLPFREGEGTRRAEPGPWYGRRLHFSSVVCISRLTAVARAAEAVDRSGTIGDLNDALNALRAALAAPDSRETDHDR